MLRKFNNSTNMNGKQPFDKDKAVLILIVILTIVYSIRGALWLATH